MQNFGTKRQFLKIFPCREKEFDQFISKNKISFEDYKSVIRLAEYCNEIIN